MESIEKIWNAIERILIQPWLAFAISASCFLIMSPALDKAGLDFLQLNTIRVNYGQWIGLISVLTFVLGCVGTVYKLYATIMKRRRIKQVKERKQEKESLKQQQAAEQAQQVVEQVKQAERKVLAYLHTLTSSEAKVLLSAVQDNRRTVCCGYPEVAESLAAKGLAEKVPMEKTRMMLIGLQLIIRDFGSVKVLLGILSK